MILQFPLLMDQLPHSEFLDVETLLRASEPRTRLPWMTLAVWGCLLVLLVTALSAGDAEHLSGMSLAAWLMSLLMFPALPFLLRWSLRAARQQATAVQALAEMVQLRRWPEAAAAVERILSQPARVPQLRAEAMVYLSAVLSRYQRFGDAITVQDYLLDNEMVNPQTAYGLKLGRAMAMLREDHLVDADRAISDLRRMGSKESAGYLLLELYRSVKTGHDQDAVELFEANVNRYRDQLGHRLADAYMLVAWAYDRTGRTSDAERAFSSATLLAPWVELARRYPETASLNPKYRPAPAPAEMA